MKRLPLALIPGLFFLALAQGCENPRVNHQVDSSPARNRLTEEERAEGWILLFDGESLRGWEDPSREDPPGHAWIVEEGCIKGVDDPALREDLFTEEKFGDFDLRFEWKISRSGNSGVKYRVQGRVLLVEGRTDPDAERFEDTVDYELKNRLFDRSSIDPMWEIEEYTLAFEYQIIDDEGHPDARESRDRRAGAIYGLAPAVEPAARPAGEFNQARIRLDGNRVEHWLNGRKLVSEDLDSESIREGLEDRWTVESPVYRLLTEMPEKETPLCLQHHDDEVWFRNIKILRLQ